MIKTFKKAIAIMLTLVFILSLVPVSSLASTEEESVKIHFSNPVWVRNTSSTKNNVQNYANYIRGGIIGSQYKAFFQLDFSGYEHLLNDNNSALKLYAQAGAATSTHKLYDFNLFILDDENDAYGEHHKVYSDSSYGWTYTELAKYIDELTTNVANTLTPFSTRSDATAIWNFKENIGSSVFDANKQVVLDALSASTDDSVVTLQFVTIGGGGKTDGFITFNPTYTYVEILSSGEDATPLNYVYDVAKNITWDKLSDETINNVTTSLNLPKKYLGVTIDWTSTREDIINPSSGEVVIKSDAAIPVTLTANMSYKPYNGKPVTTTQTFDVIVRDPSTLVTDERIKLTNYAYSRPSANNNPDARNTKYGYDSDEGIDVIKTGSSFTAYGQFDLSGYEEILSNQSTSVLTKFVAGSVGSGKIYDFKAVLTADSTDVYINSDITYNSAEKLGLHNDDRPILFIKSDGTVYNRSKEVKFETNKEALIQVLNEGTENSVVSLHFVGITHGETSIIRTNPQNSGLFISYDKTEIDNQAYLTDVKNALTWNVLSKGAQDKVSADLYLPTKFKGANIVWETDGVVIKSSGEVDFENNKSKTVTIKAKMSYTNILNDTVTDEKTFEVTISDGTCDIGEPTLVKEADKFAASWAIENYTGSDITYYVYLAAYSNNELVGLTPVTYVAKNGIPTSIAPTVECKEGYTAKLIIIEDDKLTPLFKAIER